MGTTVYSTYYEDKDSITRKQNQKDDAIQYSHSDGTLVSQVGLQDTAVLMQTLLQSMGCWGAIAWQRIKQNSYLPTLLQHDPQWVYSFLCQLTDWELPWGGQRAIINGNGVAMPCLSWLYLDLCQWVKVLVQIQVDLEESKEQQSKVNETMK